MADEVHAYPPPLPEGVTIRPGTVADVDAMAELRRRMFAEMHEHGRRLGSLDGRRTRRPNR